MQKVTKFESSDGTLFDTEEEALARDKLSNLAEWYEVNKLYGPYQGCKIEWGDFLEWCRENRREIQKILMVC